MKNESKYPFSKLIVCKEEHDDNIVNLIEDKLEGCKDIGQLVLLYNELSTTESAAIEKITDSDPNLRAVRYNSDSCDEEFGCLIKEQVGDAKVYWLKGNGLLFNRAKNICKFLILKDESLSAYEKSPYGQNDQAALPKFIGITLTNKCNYKCFFCNRESNDKYSTIDPVNFYSLKPLIQNAEILNLTGWGEPFSYKYIKDILKFINENNSKNCISLTSNGSLLTEELAELLSKNLHQLIISINAATAETYERDMSNGKWERVINNIRNARKYILREKMHFVFVGHRDNIHEFPEFVKLAAHLDVWQVELLHLQVTDLEHIKKSLWFHKEATNKFIDEAVLLGKQLNINVQVRKFDNEYENKISRFDCTAPYDQAYISESGNVAPCCYSGIQNMGNVHFHDGFHNVWNNQKYRRLRKEKYLPECQTCGNANSINNLLTHINVLLVKDPRVYQQLPLVSVVVPSYNQAEWLPKTLDSIIAQSYPVWEAVVVDDGSTDNTWSVIEEYSKKDSRIKGFYKENGGISSALNYGIEKSSGTYFCWLSSDDLFNPDKLELQIKEYEKLDESYGIIFGAFDLIDSKDKATSLDLKKPFFEGLEFPQQLKYDMIDGCTVMLPMDIMREMKGFNTQFKHAQDTDFWFRLAAKGFKFHYLENKLVKRRIHEAQGFTDFQLDCRYDGYSIVYFYLSHYSFQDFYRNVDWINIDELRKFMTHLFDMITNDDCHINHPTLIDQFWEWFVAGLKTLDKEIRNTILKSGITIFGEKKAEKEFYQQYLLKFESAFTALSNKPKVQFRLNTAFEDITKFDRSKENVYSRRLYDFGIQMEKENNPLIAASAFKYLADYPNLYSEKAFPKFIEWCFTYGEYNKFIKSFRRKGKITDFDDTIKLLYIWASISVNNAEGTGEIIDSIKETGKREIAESWLKSDFPETKVSSIKFWNYQVIPYKIEHNLKIKCEKCNEEFNRKLSLEISPVAETGSYICTNCFNAYTLSDKLLKDYFIPRINSVKRETRKPPGSPRVAFVMRYTDVIGGGVKVAYRHIQWLSELGCDITIYSDAPKPNWIDLPGKFVRLKDHYEISGLDEDAVIVFSVYDVPKVLLKANSSKVFHICQGYEGYHIGKNYEQMREDKYFYTMLHSFNVGNILVSNHLMDLFENKFGRKGNYVPNSIDLSTYYPDPGIKKEPNSILFIGNPNDPLKGIRFLIDSLSALQSSNDPFEQVTLYIVWGGRKLNGEIIDKEIAGIKIQYLIGLSAVEIAQLMNRVSLVVNCSWYEGFTLPILEAMACGTPTIVTNNMGAESFCTDAQNSFIVRHGDTQALIERLRDILLQRVDVYSIIRNGFETAAEYSNANSAKKFVREYSKILNYNFPEDKVKKLLGRFTLDTDSLKIKLEEKIKRIRTTDKPTVSIIMVTYNQAEYTLKCLNSIEKFTKTTYEIIIVDNASGDGTPEKVEAVNNVALIQNASNKGFPAAVNQGISVARGKYILILNNDVIVTENWLERMIYLMTSQEKIGIVGPISNVVSGVQFDKYAAYKTEKEMFNYAAKVRKSEAGKWFEFPRVAFLCTLIKREVINSIGGLDERFTPGNFEDDDFCLRSQLAGFKTVIAKDVFIHHYGSKSFKADGESKYAELIEINRKKFIDKWGADPNEIWIKRKQIKTRQIKYPINKDPFFQSFERAIIHVEEGEYELASEELKIAKNTYQYSTKLDCKVSYSDVEILAEKIQNIIDSTSINVSELLSCAEDYINSEELNKAQDLLNIVLQKEENNLTALNNLALVNIMSGNDIIAIDHLEKVLNLDPLNEIALNNLQYINENS